MRKSLFTVALACVLSIGGLTVAASAENYTPQSKVAFDSASGVLSSKGSESLKMLMMNPQSQADDSIGLSDFLTTIAVSGEKEFGYMLNDGQNGGKFVSLAGLLKSVKDGDVASIVLGKFEKNDTIKFGYADADGKNFSSVKIESDAGFHGGYDADSFFHLDFSEEPFDGVIEVLVIGEPLPASTVTLLVALAAGAGLLLFNCRRQRAVRTEQA
jgi:hypothetical protein